MAKRDQKTCNCDAYSFPHRLNSGKCRDTEKDRTIPAGRNFDEMLDDPRRGQAEGLNRKYQ